MEIDVFISHHTNTSLHIVEAIANKLESQGVRCWYAPRDTEGGYAGAIAGAIKACSVFLLILNKPASESVHVLNELDLVTKRLAAHENVSVLPFHTQDDEIGFEAQYYLGRLHWIDAMTPPMYERIDELVLKILTMLGRTPKENTDEATGEGKSASYELIQKIPQARDVFLGRDDLIAEIDDHFHRGDRILFLEGIGGIGKSELAKQYALQHRDEYDNLIFVTYSSGLRSLMCDPEMIEINGFTAEDGESEEEVFARKLQVFRTLTNERTLLITDNYDVDDDPDFDAYTQGSCRMIFTTRNAHPGKPAVIVKPIEKEEILFEIFERNYGAPLSGEERDAVAEMFRLTEYHTYAIELLARQMEASFLSAGEMLELLKQDRLASGATESVDGRDGTGSAFDQICSMFSVSRLDEEDKQILREMSFMGTSGVPAARFKEWAGLTSFDTVNSLIKRSWIRRESGQRISLHPLVAEVMRSRLQPTYDNCCDFMERMGEFQYYAWYRPVSENLAVKDCVLTTCAYFAPFDGKHTEIWCRMPTFLWQVAEFNQAIYYGHLVYDASLKENGEASMDTGFAAKALAGCYFNARRLDESIPWYEQGLKSMLLSGEPENEDLAMSYEKTARCNTFPGHQDFKLAEERFRKSLEIRLNLLEGIKQGKPVPLPYEKIIQDSYNEARAVGRVGEAYFEMGRMYQYMGDYQTALEYVEKYEQIFSDKMRQENPSGYAYIQFDKGRCHYHMGLNAKEAGNAAEAEEQFNAALDLFSQALDSNMRLRGGLAIDTIDNQEYLGDVYAAMGRYGEASNAYTAVVTMLENLLGEDCDRIRTVKEKMMFK